jgi:hypothetical protein
MDCTFEHMNSEIQHIIGQMNDEERRHYLGESLFLNMVSYENERLGQGPEEAERRRGGRDQRDKFSSPPALFVPFSLQPSAFNLQPFHSVPQLPGHSIHLFVAVEHDGAALRRADGVRVRGSLRQARAGRHARG